MRDAKLNELAVGDLVMIPARVTALDHPLSQVQVTLVGPAPTVTLQLHATRIAKGSADDAIVWGT